MEALLRTQVGTFTVENSVTLARVEELRDAQRLSEILYATDSVFEKFRALELKEEGERLVLNGNPVRAGLCRGAGMPEDGEEFRVYGTEGRFLAVYTWNEVRRMYMPVKMFL